MMREITWTLGTEPNPADRRHIRTAGADTEALLDIEDEPIEILDLISGERLTLERIDCGLACKCAVGIVEPDPDGDYATVMGGSLEDVARSALWKACPVCGSLAAAHGINAHCELA
jgi:hypothetical protein